MKSSDLYFTSDTHFGHKMMAEKIRGFSSTDEMDEKLISLWNSVIPPNGHVFHLGDLSFRNRPRTESILARLNGIKHLILGNHDHLSKVAYAAFQWVKDYYELKIEDTGQMFVLCHFAFRTWNKAHHGAINLHGHSHGNLPPIGGQMDVGVDTNSLAPYTYAGVMAKMALSPPYAPVDHHVGT